MEPEIWKEVEEFPNYSVSNYGRIHNNRNDSIMATSRGTFGHIKISLMDSRTRERFTRSVAVIVAEAFVDRPDELSDQVIVLDGDLSNVAAWNLAWRPRQFAWKYARQLRTQQPIQFLNLRVRNVRRGFDYKCIVDAGMQEGLLFDDIWRSTYTGDAVYPNRSVFRVVERV